MKKILTVTLNPAIDYTVDVPDFRSGHVNRASGGRRDPGGKGINVASITAKFLLNTAVTGFLGNGNSSIFTGHFERNFISDRFIYIDGNTREGIKITDPSRQITTDINFAGFRVSPEKIQEFIEYFEMIALEFDYIIMSGSLPEGLQPDFYARLAATAGKDVFVSVDASGEALRSAIDSGHVNMIKPNIHELLDAFSVDSSDYETDAAAADEICRKLLSKVNRIALSLGEKGSRLYTEDGILHATAPAVKVVSTVGAGDSFLGGLISGMALGRRPDEALRLAAATAAANLTIFGPGWSETNPPGKYYEQITVSPYS